MPHLVLTAAGWLPLLAGLRCLNRPAYAEGGKPTVFFVERFGITEREAAVVVLLLEGITGKLIACTFSKGQ